MWVHFVYCLILVAHAGACYDVYFDFWRLVDVGTWKLRSLLVLSFFFILSFFFPTLLSCWDWKEECPLFLEGRQGDLPYDHKKQIDGPERDGLPLLNTKKRDTPWLPDCFKERVVVVQVYRTWQFVFLFFTWTGRGFVWMRRAMRVTGTWMMRWWLVRHMRRHGWIEVWFGGGVVREPWGEALYVVRCKCKWSELECRQN